MKLLTGDVEKNNFQQRTQFLNIQKRKIFF
jgi:hypothetical protein